MMERHQAETGWRPNEQVIAKFPSADCRQGFDMHIYPVGGYSQDASTWFWFLGAACLTPLSRGSVRLTGAGPRDKLLIDHRYLRDPSGYDRARLAEGVERVREMADAPELRRLLGRETRPGPEVTGRQAIERFIDHAAVDYYHPAGSCKMGRRATRMRSSTPTAESTASRVSTWPTRRSCLPSPPATPTCRSLSSARGSPGPCLVLRPPPPPPTPTPTKKILRTAAERS